MLPPQAGTRTQWKDWNAAAAHALPTVDGAAEPDTSQNLTQTIAASGQAIAQAAAQGMDAINSNLSYESLIEGFMTEGERATTHMSECSSAPSDYLARTIVLAAYCRRAAATRSSPAHPQLTRSSPARPLIATAVADS